jgi:hypothetical protein
VVILKTKFEVTFEMDAFGQSVTLFPFYFFITPEKLVLFK